MLELREELKKIVRLANQMFDTNIGYVTVVRVKGDGSYHSRVTKQPLPNGDSVYTLLAATLATTTPDVLIHEVAHIVCWELNIWQSNHNADYMSVYYGLTGAYRFLNGGMKC